MMPDLGKYQAEVLSAYGITVLLIAALVGWSLVRAGRVRRALEEAEARSRTHGR